MIKIYSFKISLFPNRKLFYMAKIICKIHVAAYTISKTDTVTVNFME